MKIPPALWRKLSPLIDEALALDEAARRAWLAGLNETHPRHAPLLREMLATHEDAERVGELETVPKLAPPPPPTSDFTPGARIGPFALIRPLGRGGMGEVWLARQADGRVERELALKLPIHYTQSAALRERFRRERDILARLAHPHITRLIDAGVSDEEGSRGQPYLAMEYVDGVTLGQFAAEKKLGIEARLQLFRHILAAVARAHRHLVVHRDLKPANILIDREGEVKLLDFGIAKLIDDDHPAGEPGEATRIGGRAMTLRYAAPEQVSQGAQATISTATDVYALGVILHELLTGLSPHRAVREEKPFTEATLLNEEIARPSALALTAEAANERGLPTARALARGIEGDLDAILLKATRKNPVERYASVEQFDADIERHLQHRPVGARRGTWRYLAGRFVLRHRWPLALSAAVLIALAAGVVMVERERRIAEMHFSSVRKLANTFMFEVHGKLENVAGTLEARRMLVNTSAQYLDSLAAQAGNDTELALEVATAYRKLAEIEGDTSGSNLGEANNARRHAERAVALLESIEAREPNHLPALREHRVLALFLGRLILEGGDQTGEKQTRMAVSIAEVIAGLPGANVADQRNLGTTLAQHGGILAVVMDDHAQAAVRLARAIGILEGLVRAHPGDSESRTRLAYAYERAGTAAEMSGNAARLPEGIARFEQSIAVTEALLAEDAANLTIAQHLAVRYNNASRAKVSFGDFDGARKLTAKNLALVERLIAAAPNDAGNLSMRVSVPAMAAEIEHRSGHHERAIELARSAVAADLALPVEVRQGVIKRNSAASAKFVLGAALCATVAKGTAPHARRAVLLGEAKVALAESRAFKQELIERKIFARQAGRELAEIEAEIAKCDR
jgi:eukaryotic-like serine/threonine-protein kinase